jgi:hypothetical protein
MYDDQYTFLARYMSHDNPCNMHAKALDHTQAGMSYYMICHNHPTNIRGTRRAAAALPHAIYINAKAIAPVKDPTHAADRSSRAAPLPLAAVLVGAGAVFVLPGVITSPVGTSPEGMRFVGRSPEVRSPDGMRFVRGTPEAKKPEGKRLVTAAGTENLGTTVTTPSVAVSTDEAVAPLLTTVAVQSEGLPFTEEPQEYCGIWSA